MTNSTTSNQSNQIKSNQSIKEEEEEEERFISNLFPGKDVSHIRQLVLRRQRMPVVKNLQLPNQREFHYIFSIPDPIIPARVYFVGGGVHDVILAAQELAEQTDGDICRAAEEPPIIRRFHRFRLPAHAQIPPVTKPAIPVFFCFCFQNKTTTTTKKTNNNYNPTIPFP